jgi:LPXTG-motif cell wall-anchored protein
MNLFLLFEHGGRVIQHSAESGNHRGGMSTGAIITAIAGLVTIVGGIAALIKKKKD